MFIVLFLLSVLAVVAAYWLASMTMLTPNVGGVLPILAGAWLVIAAIFFVGAAIVEAINSRAREILKRLPEPAKPAPKTPGPYSEDLIA